MKLHFYVFLFISFILAAPLWAQESDQASPEAVVSEEGAGLQIRVGPATYSVTEPSNEELREFEQLSEQDQKSFMTNRKGFLSALARGLQALNLGFGAGGVVGDRLKFTRDHYRHETFLAKYRSLDPETRKDIGGAVDAHLEEQIRAEDERVHLTLRERGQAAISHLLHGIDRKLWSQSKLMAHSNEFGLTVSMGIQALGGTSGKHAWGGLFDIGISIGYNRDTKSLAIQIFRNFERYESTMMKAVFVAGVLGKLGVYVGNKANDSVQYKGKSFYPPMVPGYTSWTPEYFSFGASTGLNIPPPPFGDALTYTNRLDHKDLIRISISPLLKGFIRMETSLGPKSLLIFLEPIKKVVQLFTGHGRTQIMCRQLFAN